MNMGKHSDLTAGLALLGATLLALILANSPLSGIYRQTWDFPLLSGGPSLLFLINDLLMAVFFFLVGVEIKREAIAGSLADPKNAMGPLAGALGGMAVPALIYLLVNRNHPAGLAGWAIPAATDIAFALGVLALAGRGLPSSLRAFLLALAVIDDLGAIVIIALFYSGGVHLAYLTASLILMIGLAGLARAKITVLPPYFFLGAALWGTLLGAGIHPVLAGAATGLALPAPRLDKLIHHLHGPVCLIIMPLFALANAGLDLAPLAWADLARPIPLGIALALVLGKPLGVLGGLYLARGLGLAQLPAQAGLAHLLGIATLCGIGFTMSLFIGTLAFTGTSSNAPVQMGILTGSALAALSGLAILFWAQRSPEPHPGTI